MSSTASSADAGRGAVYDRGYRPYDGPRGRRGAATLALYKASMRRALGLRRPWRQKVAPFVLLGVVTIPAIVNVGIGYVTRDRFDGFQIITYREYVGVSSALLLFVALVAPDVMCPDRRHRVLPLMFARPLLGVDYVVAKVGSITTILFAFSFLPQVVLFVGNMLVSNSALDYVGDHLVGDSSVEGGGYGGLINVLAMPLHLRDVIFLGHIDPDSPLSGVAGGGLLALACYLVVLCTGAMVLWWRYRWVER